MSPLPVNVDSTYPDRSPGDALHQQHHDLIHAVINGLGTASTHPSTDFATAAQGAKADAAQVRRPWEFNPEDYGAKRDGKIASDVATNSTNTFTSPTIAADSQAVGKWVMINGGRGVSDFPAIGTITAVAGNNITIDTSVSTLPINFTTTNLNAVWGTNDRTAINLAATAAKTYAEANNYHADVVFSDGVYVVAGNTRTSDGNVFYNAQIPIPYPTGNNKRKMVIGFRGASRADHLEYWNSTVPNLAGTTIVSMDIAPQTLDGTYGPQAVFGAPVPDAGIAGGTHGNPSFINHKPVVTNIQVVCSLFTSLTAFNFSYSGGVFFDGCSAMAFAQPLEGTGALLNDRYNTFGVQQGVGARLPVAGNNADVWVPAFTVEGFNIGLDTPSEHVLVGVLKALYLGVVLRISGSTTGHGLTILHVTAEAYQGGILYTGGAGNLAPLRILSWTTEVAPIAYDISDVANALRGEVNFFDTADGDRLPIVTGAANLRIIDVLKPLGAWSSQPAVPASTVNQKNTSWRTASVSVNGGTVTAIVVDGVTQASTTNRMVMVPPGKNISITYSSAPVWAWTLL